MDSFAQNVITLAQNTKALSKEQLARILELAPKMDRAKLEDLKRMLDEIRAEELASMKRELELRKKVASAYEEWKADKTRNALKLEEGAVTREDSAQAESLIQNV